MSSGSALTDPPRPPNLQVSERICRQRLEVFHEAEVVKDVRETRGGRHRRRAALAQTADHFNSPSDESV